MTKPADMLPTSLPPMGHPLTKPSTTPVDVVVRMASQSVFDNTEPPATDDTWASTYSFVVASAFADGADSSVNLFSFELPELSRSMSVFAVAFAVALSSFDLSAFDMRPFTDVVATGLSESAVFD